MADEERKDEAPKEEKPQDEAPQEETPQDEAPQDETPQEETPQDEAPQEETPQDEAPQEETPQQDEAPQEEAPAAKEEAPAAEEEAPAPQEEAPAAQEAPPAADEEAPAAEKAPATEEAPAAEESPKPPPERAEKGKKEEVVPGAHLEPDLVLEEERRAEAEGEFGQYATDETAVEGEEGAPEGEGPAPDSAPQPREPVQLAADARYIATGKRKTAVARVILRPGKGGYTINGRSLEEYFPRAALQNAVKAPIETAGYETTMDVHARIHGGGVSSQAGALRHGVARALIEADPALRGELKRRGFLTRDARAKERRKAGLKKARKRPQFSKR
jgi:small subunit ribosomal protein S9